MTIYTAISVLTDANPSPNTIQWSEEGQVLIVTRNAIYILTPDIGIAFDTASTISALPDEKDGGSGVVPPLSWFRTLIGLEKNVGHIWGLESQEYMTLILGTLEKVWKAACWSPTNLSSEGCCLLAAMNTNLELSIWEPSLNHLKGVWNKVQDVTALLKAKELEDIKTKLPAEGEHPTELGAEELINAQIQSFSWSKQVNYTLESKTFVDGSLLALGTRSGRIVLLRLEQSTRCMVIVHIVQLTDHWVTHLAWSDWRMTEPDKCEAILACALPTGRIRRVAIRQSLVLANDQDGNLSPFEQVLTTSILPGESPSISDGKSITSLSWIPVPDRRPLLVHTKPGALFIWSLEHGLRSVILRRQATCSGSSALLPPCGLIYRKERDCILLTLQDSSVHVIYSVSSSPALDPPIDEEDLQSFHLSQLIRSTNSAVENKKFRSDDMLRCSGMVAFDTMGAVMWLGEHWRPHDFDYKPESKRKNTLVVKQLWDSPHGEIGVSAFLAGVARILGGDLSDPIFSTRTILFGLRKPLILEGAKEGLLKMLTIPSSSTPPLRQSIDEIRPMELDDIPLSTRTSFKKGIQCTITRSKELSRLRLKYNIAMTCFNLSKDRRFEGTVEGLLRAISQQTLRVVLEEISAFRPFLQDADLAFEKRVIQQYFFLTASRNGRSLPDSKREKESDDNSMLDQSTISGDQSFTVKLNERCPACQEEIVSGDIRHANCRKGHRWMRCSVTSFILATTKTRTCVGCSQKALAPFDGNDLRSVEYGWVVKELLDAVRCCLLCGNRFVRLV